MNKRILVISHTHWDREWYKPLEEFRVQLADMVDNLLNTMDHDERFNYFHLDGQTIVLEDYFAERPHNRERLEQYIRDGRILVGPWYVQPDEFLVSGESHIRNLLIGHRIARTHDTVMPVGYLPDCFGHISQMPQILRGFGIDSSMFWRGVGEEITTTEFIWEAPDGSSVFTVYLRYGYSNAVELPGDEQALLNRVDQLRDDLEPWATTRWVLFMNGSDHKYLQNDLADLIAIVRRRDGEHAIAQTSMPELVTRLKAETSDLYTYRGEFRSPLRSNILPGVYSARMYLKQLNTHLENLLEKRVEPVAVCASLTGADYPKRELSSIWKRLIQNNAHDSICGCSIDRVHDEMEQRFAALADEERALLNRGMFGIAEQLDTAALGGAEPAVPVVVFNSLQQQRTGPVQCDCVFDGTTYNISFIAEDVPGFGCKTYLVQPAADDGGPALLESIPHYITSPGIDAANPTSGLQRYGPADDIPALENEFFRIELHRESGTLTVLNKQTGTTLPMMNQFIDEGDAGDEYNFCPPAGGNTVIGSGELQPDILMETSPVRQTLTYRLIYRLPEAVTEDRRQRSAMLRDCPVTARVTLYPGIKRIDFQTAVDNTVKDHRLRVLFPAGLESNYSLAEGHFDLVKRPADVPAGDEWFEQPMADFPQKSFAVIGDGTAFMGLLNKGLSEAEIIRSETQGAADLQSAIALTLVRAVGWLSRDDLSTRKDGHAGPGMATPGAQCLRKFVFEYALIPRLQEGELEHLFHDGAAYNNPLESIVTGLHDGELPPALSFILVDPAQLVVSALKQAEDTDASILRIFNPGTTAVVGSVSFYRPFDSVQEVNLNEEPVEPGNDKTDGFMVTEDKTSFSFSVGSGSIVTFAVR